MWFAGIVFEVCCRHKTSPESSVKIGNPVVPVTTKGLKVYNLDWIDLSGVVNYTMLSRTLSQLMVLKLHLTVCLFSHHVWKEVGNTFFSLPAPLAFILHGTVVTCERCGCQFPPFLLIIYDFRKSWKFISEYNMILQILSRIFLLWSGYEAWMGKGKFCVRNINLIYRTGE